MQHKYCDICPNDEKGWETNVNKLYFQTTIVHNLV